MFRNPDYNSLAVDIDTDQNRAEDKVSKFEYKKKSFALPGSLFIVSAATSLAAALALSEGEQTAAQKLIVELQNLMETYSHRSMQSQ